jgi:O-antigen ligase
MNFLVAIAIVAAAIWAVAFVLRGSLLAGCMVFLVLAVALGHEFLNFDVGPLPLTLDRIWIGLLIAMFVVQWKLGWTHPKPFARVDLVLLGFLALLTASTLVVGATDKAATGGSPLWHLVIAYVFPTVLYFVARQSALTESSVVMVHGFLALFGIYLGVTGVAEMSGQWAFVFPGYIADPDVGLHYGRARGPMVQSVSFGLYLGISVVATLLWMMRFGRAGKLMLMLLVPLELAAVGLTLTRSVWLGTALALLVLAALMLQGTWRRGVVFGAVAAASLLVATRLENITGFAREGTAHDTRTSAESRASFAYVSWKMFQDRPVLGFGFGQFPEAKLPYLDDRSTDLNLEQIRPLAHHNTYLCLLVELGLVGLVLYMTLLGLWVRSAWLLYREPRRPAWVRAHGMLVLAALSTYAVQMMFHDVSYTSVDNALVYLLAGIAVGLNHGGNESRRTDSGRASDRSSAIRFSTQGAAVIENGANEWRSKSC